MTALHCETLTCCTCCDIVSLGFCIPVGWSLWYLQEDPLNQGSTYIIRPTTISVSDPLMPIQCLTPLDLICAYQRLVKWVFYLVLEFCYHQIKENAQISQNLPGLSRCISSKHGILRCRGPKFNSIGRPPDHRVPKVSMIRMIRMIRTFHGKGIHQRHHVLICMYVYIYIYTHISLHYG